MHFNIERFFFYIPKLLPYLKTTFVYVAVALGISLLWGALLTAFKLGKNRPLKTFGVAYTATFRSVPPVVLLFLVYYGLPNLVHVNPQNRMFYVCVTLTLLCSASISEIMRGAYQSVPRGQYEAGESVGMTNLQIIRRIMLPQAFYFALPNLSTIIIGLLKDGSLAFTIGLVDVFGKANLLNNTTFSKYVLEIYAALTLIYWILAVAIEKISALLDSILSQERAKKARSRGGAK
ncbi:MAG: amino acid ABC transporter permease [Treponema sp.]|nr:amino acid ABC transporter permease [Treponema sp.]MBQ9625621.1 amino acid ABC transporter permease [Treponema sp.]